MNEMTGLIVDVEARITKLERGLKLANDRQRKAATEMERRAQQSARKIESTYGGMTNGIAAKFASMKNLALPFLGGLGAGIAAGGATALIGNLDRVAEGMANIGNEAARAGLSTQVFQEWSFLAKQNRIDVDALIDGFKELNLRADEFIATGVGPAAEAFTRLGYRATDLKEKLKDPSALMLEILGRMEGFDKAGQIRIADEVFGGTGGERFVELLAQGQGALRETINRAHETGAVLDAELIAKADQINRRFKELTTTASTFGKRVVVELVAAGAELADFRARLDSIFDSEAEGRAILGNELYDALARDRDAVDQQAEALARLNERYSALAEEAGRAGVAMLDAITRLDSLGYDQAADGLRMAYEEMQALVQAFRDGEISGDDFTAKLGEIEAAASDAFATLEAGDRTTFTGVMSQLSRLGGVIASVTSLANSMGAAIARAAGVDAGTKGTQALRDRHAAEAASMDSMEAQREALDGFTAAENARNTATSEQLRLQREIEAVRDRAGAAGATLTDGQATQAAQAAIAAEEARAAADRAARAGGGPGKASGGDGGSKEKLDDYAREAQAIRDKTQALQIESAVLMEVATSQRQHGDAVAFADAKTRLLVAAHQAGQSVTQAQMAQIDQLAASYASAGAEAERAGEKMEAATEKAASNLEAGASGLTEIFSAARQGSDALSSTLNRLAGQIMDNVFQSLLTGMSGGAGGGGILSGALNFLGSALTGGFAEGGYTGNGGKYEPAGVVHRGEFVFSKETVQRLGAGNLERLHQSARKGYAEGGLVSAAGKVTKAASARPGASAEVSAPVVTINSPITVNGSAGTPEQNADLAKQVARETEGAMRGLVQQELVRQLRPGGLLR